MDQKNQRQETLVKMQSSLPFFAAILKQLWQHYQVDLALALSMLLGAASTALHYLIDVISPLGQRGPASLAVIVFVDTGGGKSSVMSRVMRPIYAYESVLFKLHEEKELEYKKSLDIWEAKKKILKRALGKTDFESDEYIKAMDRLAEHESSKPQPPFLHQVIFEDATVIPFIKQLSKSGHAAMVSAEGINILEGKLSEAISVINSGWSGENYRYARSGKTPIVISSPRVTSLIAVQKELFLKIPKASRDKMAVSGFIPRQVVFDTESMNGKRFLADRNESTEYLEMLDLRLTEILERLHTAMQTPDFKRKALTLSPEAATYWRLLMDDLERMKAEGEYYAQAGSHASRLGENVLRVAAVLHEFEGLQGPISKEVVEIATNIIEACSHDYMGVFSPAKQDLADAEELYAYFLRLLAHNQRFERKAFLRRCGPYKLREKGDRFNNALAVLINEGRVRIIYHGQTAYVDFQPHLPLPHLNLPPNGRK